MAKLYLKAESDKGKKTLSGNNKIVCELFYGSKEKSIKAFEIELTFSGIINGLPKYCLYIRSPSKPEYIQILPHPENPCVEQQVKEVPPLIYLPITEEERKFLIDYLKTDTEWKADNFIEKYSLKHHNKLNKTLSKKLEEVEN